MAFVVTVGFLKRYHRKQMCIREFAFVLSSITVSYNALLRWEQNANKTVQ
jgi:hypothetical protein